MPTFDFSNYPFHPAVVHFPIAVSIITPFLFLALLLGISRGHWPAKIWVVGCAFQIFLFVSSFAAVKLGERDEERVEKYIHHDIIHEHEEWGERTLWLQGIVMVLAGISIAFPGRLKIKRIVTVGSFLAAVPTGFSGFTGGKLVYEHGAARAYTDNLPPKSNSATEDTPLRPRDLPPTSAPYPSEPSGDKNP